MAGDAKFTPVFRKVDSCTYQYAGTEYLIEQMADGSWDAYLPSQWGYRLWQSCAHRSRKNAAIAISMERRRVAKRLREALPC